MSVNKLLKNEKEKSIHHSLMRYRSSIIAHHSDLHKKGDIIDDNSDFTSQFSLAIHTKGITPAYNLILPRKIEEVTEYRDLTITANIRLQNEWNKFLNAHQAELSTLSYGVYDVGYSTESLLKPKEKSIRFTREDSGKLKVQTKELLKNQALK